MGSKLFLFFSGQVLKEKRSTCDTSMVQTRQTPKVYRGSDFTAYVGIVFVVE